MRAALWADQVLVFCLLILLATTCASCNNNDDESRAVASSPDLFTWTADVSHESSTRNFNWDSAISGNVRVEFRGKDFTGEFRVQVYDGDGANVLDEEYTELGIRDVVEFEFTEGSVPGGWRIRIDLNNASGELSLQIAD